MSHMFATVTSKGQITLPAAARRMLGIQPGQKVELRVVGDSLVIDAPHDVASVRSRIRNEATRRGTWGGHPSADDGRAARSEDFRAGA